MLKFQKFSKKIDSIGVSTCKSRKRLLFGKQKDFTESVYATLLWHFASVLCHEKVQFPSWAGALVLRTAGQRSCGYFLIFTPFVLQQRLDRNKYLQLLDVHRALMQAVLPQGNVEMTGEPRLGQLQPAMELLQTGEQGEAEGRAVAALRGLGNLRFDGFSLPPFLLFISWGKFRGN